MKRRRYQGWRGIFSAFGRFFRKAKDAVVSFAKGLIDALKKGIGYAMNVVRYVVGATRMAVRVTKLSIQRLQGWLFGKVIGSGTPPQVTMTRYQLDFDTLQVVDRDCPEAIVTQHSRVLDWMQRSFEVMITIAMKVVKVVLAAVNWLLLAWRVLQLIREVVKIVKADPLHGLFDKSAAI